MRPRRRGNWWTRHSNVAAATTSPLWSCATSVIESVLPYHDGTKHHFQAFARSLGYLDWATQPHSFRAYEGAPTFPLFPSPAAASSSYRIQPLPFDELFTEPSDPVPLN